MRQHTDSRNGLLVATSAWLIWFQVVALAVTMRAADFDGDGDMDLPGTGRLDEPLA